MTPYGKSASLNYSVSPRRLNRLRQQVSTVKSKKAKAAAAAPTGPAVANVMDVAYFLARYLSGKSSVVIAPQKYSSGFSVQILRDLANRDYYQINLPQWQNYELPVKSFDRYRIYREGVWHEACHVKYTPRDLFGAVSSNQMLHDLINIIEDRRIEDLGVKEWRGYLPERIYTQAYAWAVRPPVDRIQSSDGQRYEAFLQRLLIGKYKGKLPAREASLVENAAAMVEAELARIEPDADPYRIGRTVVDLAERVASMLGFDPKTPLQKVSNSQSSWEDTFSDDFPRKQGASTGEIEQGMEEFFKEKEKAAKAKTKTKDPAEEPKPTEVTPEDVQQAKQGSVDVRSEYEKIQRQEPIDPALMRWNPVASRAPPNQYRDAKFINAMNTFLRKWKEGYVRIVGKSGASFSVKEYIRSQEEPYITRLKQSVKGRKLLLVADFSGSMMSRSAEYKKALISSMEVLNSIGSSLALFAFAEDPAQGEGFYKLKTFEEPRWTDAHSSKLAALIAGYNSTPTDSAYRALEKYVQRHKPAVMVTVTDGAPDHPDATREMVSELKKHTRTVAFGIASPSDREKMENSLRQQGYHKSFAVSNVYDIPPKLVNLIIS